jgi:hypothetical protein
VVQINATTFRKTSGGNGWQNTVSSVEGYDSVSLKFQFESGSDSIWMGLSEAPRQDSASYTDAYYWYRGNGLAVVVESGISKWTGPAIGSTDKVWITYDNIYIRYYLNGALVYQTYLPGKNMKLSAAMYSDGGGVWGVSYGKMLVGSELVAASVTANELAAGAVTTSKLDANAVTADKVQAGAITTDKLKVPGRSRCLNSDPNCTDVTAWFNWGTDAGQSQAFWVADMSAYPKEGRTALASTGCHIASQEIPVYPGQKLRASAWVTRYNSASGSGGTYLRIYWYNAVGQNISVSEAPGNGAEAGPTWEQRAMVVDVPDGAVVCRIVVILAWTGNGGTQYAQGVKLEELVGSVMIEDGAVSADKILAGAVSAGKVASRAITTENLDVRARRLINDLSRPDDGLTGWDGGTLSLYTSGADRALQTADDFLSSWFAVGPYDILEFSFEIEVVNFIGGSGLYLGLSRGQSFTRFWYSGGRWSPNGVDTNAYFLYDFKGIRTYCTGYILGSNALASDLPSPRGQQCFALRLAAGDIGCEIRTGFNAIVGNPFWRIYRPALRHLGGGKIIADQIEAEAINGTHVEAQSLSSSHIDVQELVGSQAFFDSMKARELEVTGTVKANNGYFKGELQGAYGNLGNIVAGRFYGDVYGGIPATAEALRAAIVAALPVGTYTCDGGATWGDPYGTHWLLYSFTVSWDGIVRINRKSWAHIGSFFYVNPLSTVVIDVGGAGGEALVGKSIYLNDVTGIAHIDGSLGDVRELGVPTNPVQEIYLPGSTDSTGVTYPVTNGIYKTGKIYNGQTVVGYWTKYANGNMEMWGSASGTLGQDVQVTFDPDAIFVGTYHVDYQPIVYGSCNVLFFTLAKNASNFHFYPYNLSGYTSDAVTVTWRAVGRWYT